MRRSCGPMVARRIRSSAPTIDFLAPTRSNDVRPGPDASTPAFQAGRMIRAGSGGAAAARVRPAPLGLLQSSCGRVTRRRSTATSWRSISSSASFAAGLRANSMSPPPSPGRTSDRAVAGSWAIILAPCLLGRTCSSTHTTEFRAPTTPRALCAPFTMKS
jgi:hypothetical protein